MKQTNASSPSLCQEVCGAKMMSVSFLLVLDSFFCVLEVPVITKKPGDNVLLHCKDPTNDSIGRLEWIRPDLLPDGYVFYFKDGRPYKGFPRKIFRDRVELSEPQMKDGDVSVVLRNVTANDTGTYVCNVTTSKTNKSITINEISLIVKDQGEFVDFSFN